MLVLVFEVGVAYKRGLVCEYFKFLFFCSGFLLSSVG